MNYSETMDYLFEALPVFHRSGPAAYKANLDNTIALCKLTGNPEKELRCIHVAGTNGKGSVTHMLASVLQASGYKTGIYSSPHLKDFRERIKVDGEMVEEEWVNAFVEKYKKDFEEIKPSFFEMSTVMALCYFREMEVDIAVIETGLGGRLDSTNVVTPMVSVITNIGHDHMDLLGDTLEKLAIEKAGIIKAETPVVIGEAPAALQPVFNERANLENAEITYTQDLYTASCNDYDALRDYMLAEVLYEKDIYYKNLRLDLTGRYQLKNVCTALSVIDYLKEDFEELTEANIRKGLRSVKSSTGFRGRWDVISREPLTICDTAHNPEGMREVAAMLNRVNPKDMHLVIGMVEEKDHAAMLSLLPAYGKYYFCKADIPRGLDAEKLKEIAEQSGLKGEAYGSVAEAVAAAKSAAGKDDLVFIGGSTFTVAEAI